MGFFNMAQVIEVNEFKKKLNQVYVIDVREADEYQEGHIEGAVNIPLGRLIRDLGMGIVPREKEVVVHCKSGGRGQIAVEFLERMGYTNVKNLAGGYKAWVMARN